jgi:hypothetical protein
MSTEDRLSEALRARAERVEPSAGGWERIQAGVDGARRRHRARTAGLGALAAAAAVLIVVGIMSVTTTGDQTVEVGPADTTPGTDTTAPPPPGDDPDDEHFPGIWPFTSQEEVEAWDGEVPEDGWDYRDPEDTALDFAESYLGMAPFGVVRSQGGDTRHSVGITTREDGFVTDVHLVLIERGSGEGVWVVYGAGTDNIRLSQPDGLDEVTSPVTIAGESTAHEGTVLVEVRQDGQAFGESLTRAFYTAGSMGDFAPFEEPIDFNLPTRDAGAIVLYTDSMEDGSIQEATVVRVRFGEVDHGGEPEDTGVAVEVDCDYAPTMPAPAEGQTEVSVYFSCLGEPIPVPRRVEGPGVLRAAMEALLQGPTGTERSRGFTSFFSEETEGLLLGVTVRDGLAVVDFPDALLDHIGGASTSAGSREFLASLNATVFQFDQVERVEYRIDGRCEAFGEFIQAGRCEVFERP